MCQLLSLLKNSCDSHLSPCAPRDTHTHTHIHTRPGAPRSAASHEDSCPWPCAFSSYRASCVLHFPLKSLHPHQRGQGRNTQSPSEACSRDTRPCQELEEQHLQMPCRKVVPEQERCQPRSHRPGVELGKPGGDSSHFWALAFPQQDRATPDSGQRCDGQEWLWSILVPS